MSIEPDRPWVAPVRSRLARVLGVHADERAWRRGANGERAAARWLGRLPAGWHLIHDIALGTRGANIDHLVVGPGGVFAINAKNLTGAVWIGRGMVLHEGHRTDFLTKAAAEARRASAMLGAAIGRPVEVKGVVAILADEWTIEGRPSDVFVAAPRGVKDWMLRLPAVLTPGRVDRIAAAAADPTTWRGSDRPPRCACGGQMVRRVRHRDGVPFFGCSRYPECRRTRSIDA
jgi:hypothetical protein